LAEELFVGDISTGASSDIMQASHIARAMVRDYGMSSLLGPIKFSPDENRNFFVEAARDYSEKTAEQIDSEVTRLITTAYEEAKQILLAHKTELESLKDALLKYETVDAEDVKRILAGQAVTKPTVADLINSEAQRRAAEARREAERRGEDAAGGAVGLPQPG
jgi:cell division protease FtsH